jgi:hypothetical protein
MSVRTLGHRDNFGPVTEEDSVVKEPPWEAAVRPAQPDVPTPAAEAGPVEAGPVEAAAPPAPSRAEAVRAGAWSLVTSVRDGIASLAGPSRAVGRSGRQHRVGAGLLIMAALTAVAVVAVGTLHQPVGRLTSASSHATASGLGAAGSGGASAGAGGPLSLRAAAASAAGRSDASLRLILRRDGQSAGPGAAGSGPAGSGLPAPGRPRGAGPGGSGRNPGAPAPAAPRQPGQHKTAPPAPATITATGHVTCLSGAAVEGVWVVGRSGGSGWATWQASAQTASFASFSRQISNGDWEVHVGCGGSPSTWKVATYSGWVSGTSGFTCDDISGQGQYGQCST